MLVVLGLNHTTAEVGLREQLHFPKERLGSALERLRAVPGVQEGMILSTCNRVEVMAVVDELEPTLPHLRKFLCDNQDLSGGFDQALYVHTDEKALSHLFRVTSSLDSMVVGEPQILGQVKDAFRTAMAAGTTGNILNRCLHRALHVAKRVRTETGVASHAVSMGSVAVELAEKIFEKLSEQVVLLIGAGEMMEETAQRLTERGVSEILVTNRTHETALALAKRFQGTTFFIEKLASHLPRADIVMACTSAGEPLVKSEVVAEAMQHRAHRPLYFIDLSVPRNIEEAVGGMENVFLYDVDDFQTIVEKNLKHRQKELHLAEMIVETECRLFAQRLGDRHGENLIAGLSQKAQAIADQEVERTLKKLANVQEADREALRVMAQSIARKVVSDPINELKRLGGSEDLDDTGVHWIRRLFRL